MTDERAIRVFLIDDDPDVCKAVAMMLTDAGFDIASATDLAVAIAAIADVAPDIVVTDLQMPGSSDASVVGLLRTAFPALPIIAMSGNHALAMRALALGADDFFPKPTGRVVFIERIRALVRRGLR